MPLNRILNAAIGPNYHSPRLQAPVEKLRLDRSSLDVRGLFSGGAACPGCGENSGIKTVIQTTKAIGKQPILAIATGCTEVTNMPGYSPPIDIIKAMGKMKPHELSAFDKQIQQYAGISKFATPTIHLNFESAAPLGESASLVRDMYDEDGVIAKNLFKILVWGGDGGIEDIGFGAVLGVADRGGDIKIFEGINRTYANTGGQRVGARTYKGSNVVFAPYAGDARGKKEEEKDLIEVLLANGFKYAAFASPIFQDDLITKIQKALSIKGPTYVGISSFCPQVQGAPSHAFYRSPKLEIDSRLFWLYEAEVLPGDRDVLYTLNYLPKEDVPVKEFFGTQKLYRGLVKNEQLIAEHQERVDLGWRFWNPILKAA